MSKNLKGNLILLITTSIWGFAFVFQDIVSEKLGAFTILAMRSFIGAASLLLLSVFLPKNNKDYFFKKDKTEKRKILTAGIVCGFCLCVASSFQQIAMGIYPTEAAVPARSGFITALYVVFVPIISVLFNGKKLNLNMFISIILSVTGLYLLCVKDDFKNIYMGDIIMLLSALSFAIHIISVDTIGAKINAFKLSFIQFLTCGIISAVLALIIEHPNIKEITDAIVPLLYLGVFSSGIAFTCQIIGQQYSNNAVVASMIMSLESVFAAIGGALFGDVLTGKEIFGCLIMFSAVIISNLPAIKLKKEKSFIKEKV